MNKVFVSYSRKDKEWLKRFEDVFKPLSRNVDADLDLWSDGRIKPGDDWKTEIGIAMDSACAAVLLVSVNFLASDFIVREEIPYLLDAAKERNLRILLVRLTPCYIDATPLRHIQAVAGMPEALNEMADHEWTKAFCDVCGEVDSMLKDIERPAINSKLNGQTVKREEPELQVLEKPAVRETEVLVYSGDGWHTQCRVAKGKKTAKCWIGDEKHTKPGAQFKIVAITRDDGHLKPGSRHPSIPRFRTKSDEVTVIRA
jgi:TIR domain